MAEGVIDPLDLSESDSQSIHELAEVVLVEGEVHEVVLDDEGVRLVVGSYKTAVFRSCLQLAKRHHERVYELAEVTGCFS